MVETFVRSSERPGWAPSFNEVRFTSSTDVAEAYELNLFYCAAPVVTREASKASNLSEAFACALRSRRCQ